MKLLAIGAGGYFKSFLDTIHPTQFEIVGLLDDRYPAITEWFGYPVLGTLADASGIIAMHNVHNVFVAIGDATKRKSVYEQIKDLPIEFPTIIDSSATVSRQAKIGQGTFIGKASIINNDVEIGQFSVVNSGAIVEHGSRVGNNVNLSPGSIVNGQVTIGDNTMIGAGSITIQTLTIGKNVVVGAGTVIINDIPEGALVVGNPGRVIKLRDATGAFQRI